MLSSLSCSQDPILFSQLIHMIQMHWRERDLLNCMKRVCDDFCLLIWAIGIVVFTPRDDEHSQGERPHNSLHHSSVSII